VALPKTFSMPPLETMVETVLPPTWTSSVPPLETVAWGEGAARLDLRGAAVEQGGVRGVAAGEDELLAAAGDGGERAYAAGGDGVGAPPDRASEDTRPPLLTNEEAPVSRCPSSDRPPVENDHLAAAIDRRRGPPAGRS
jgi:hypothetical protein